jgi:hypothetical protein
VAFFGQRSVSTEREYGIADGIPENSTYVAVRKGSRGAMPGLNGIELAKHAERVQPAIKVMFATGYFVRAHEAIHLGRLFIKPVRMQRIEAEIREMMAIR